MDNGKAYRISANNFAANEIGMTLVEILVTLALLSIIFGLVILPLTKSFDLMRRARVAGSLESAIMLTLRQIEADISKARIVFLMKSPYDLQDKEVGDDDSFGRIDIVLGDSDAIKLGIPLIPQGKIVTYYGRFRDPTKPHSLEPKFTNPRVLYRAEHLPTDIDGDGRYSEDPNDGLDNDGDGRNDEDPFNAPESAITPLDGMDLAGLRFWYDVVAKAMVVDIKLQKLDPTVRIRIDNDNDGRINEDPADGNDNDGDGRIDEDPVERGTLLIRRQMRINLDYWTEVIYW
ncbi:MAG: hypothetical protein RMK18_03750 [Armatimonadota bacterium]|nr:hypothetical protein [Armatimonadota bacterium]MCX7778039.1 hypothetical protein [Armatimonadota bacterium]MDW8024963.1 hypothetical protein [Armatimonadota bacterium]